MCLVVSSLVGCAAPLEAPSAFLGERFLCEPDQAAEFEAFAAACRLDYMLDGSCLGVASGRGELEGDSFVFDSRLYRSYGDTSLINARGYSPYFGYYVSLTNLRAVRETSSSCEVELALFGFEVRGASTTTGLTFHTCTIAPRFEGWHVAFSATIARGGFVDACLFLLPENRVP